MVLKDLYYLLIGSHNTKEVERKLRDGMKISNPTASNYLERAANLVHPNPIQRSGYSGLSCFLKVETYPSPSRYAA